MDIKKTSSIEEQLLRHLQMQQNEAKRATQQVSQDPKQNQKLNQTNNLNKGQGIGNYNKLQKDTYAGQGNFQPLNLNINKRQLNEFSRQGRMQKIDSASTCQNQYNVSKFENLNKQKQDVPKTKTLSQEHKSNNTEMQQKKKLTISDERNTKTGGIQLLQYKVCNEEYKNNIRETKITKFNLKPKNIQIKIEKPKLKERPKSSYKQMRTLMFSVDQKDKCQSSSPPHHNNKQEKSQLNLIKQKNVQYQTLRQNAKRGIKNSSAEKDLQNEFETLLKKSIEKMILIDSKGAQEMHVDLNNQIKDRSTSMMSYLQQLQERELKQLEQKLDKFTKNNNFAIIQNDLGIDTRKVEELVKFFVEVGNNDKRFQNTALNINACLKFVVDQSKQQLSGLSDMLTQQKQQYEEFAEMQHENERLMGQLSLLKQKNKKLQANEQILKNFLETDDSKPSQQEKIRIENKKLKTQIEINEKILTEITEKQQKVLKLIKAIGNSGTINLKQIYEDYILSQREEIMERQSQTKQQNKKQNLMEKLKFNNLNEQIENVIGYQEEFEKHLQLCSESWRMQAQKEKRF